VNASEIIWEFFNRHSLQGTINSVNELAADKKISIYPNPTNNLLNIEWKDLNVKSIELTDITGRKILTEKKSDSFASIINISNLESGAYILTLNHDKGRIAKRFVKE
jgi:hypothetical protein